MGDVNCEFLSMKFLSAFNCSKNQLKLSLLNLLAIYNLQTSKLITARQRSCGKIMFSPGRLFTEYLGGG